ncbi:hypothetical protein NB636_06145 [Oxalobacter aliiformigenes]|uniref:hypothetical protein n=1 Tax=Oxalobacter aliiformigenes TaxID=2946593 RepID=UPI0022AF2527|nr:hypothetical protein [Oxalobacter aliiformigenes]WAW00454.1 hypothetical protein NB636_06145 [Oxalobacter aliiformigenes]
MSLPTDICMMPTGRLSRRERSLILSSGGRDVFSGGAFPWPVRWTQQYSAKTVLPAFLTGMQTKSDNMPSCFPFFSRENGRDGTMAGVPFIALLTASATRGHNAPSSLSRLSPGDTFRRSSNS